MWRMCFIIKKEFFERGDRMAFGRLSVYIFEMTWCVVHILFYDWWMIVDLNFHHALLRFFSVYRKECLAFDILDVQMIPLLIRQKIMY